MRLTKFTMNQPETFKTSIERFNDFASEYAARHMDISSYKSSIDKFCDIIKNNQPYILELACGPGNVTRYIKDRFVNSNYIAIDLAPNMIDIAKKRTKGVEFRIMDVRDISTINTEFDAIMCSFCLPFLSKSDTNKLIADCANKLKQNGAIYISTMEGDESMAGFESTGFSGDNKVYFNYHKQIDLENALENNGFSIIQMKRQDYIESDGSITIDMILIGQKRK